MASGTTATGSGKGFGQPGEVPGWVNNALLPVLNLAAALVVSSGAAAGSTVSVSRLAGCTGATWVASAWGCSSVTVRMAGTAATARATAAAAAAEAAGRENFIGVAF